MQVIATKSTTRASNWHPGVAAVLSFFIPGVGQMYKGQIGQGFAWLFFTLLAYAIVGIIGFIVHIFCIVGAARDYA